MTGKPKPVSKKKMGRPPFTPSDAQRAVVTALRANGIEPPDIAAEFGISRETLYKYFRPEIDRGFVRVKAKIGAMVVQKALKGDNACMFFWLKTQAGWREIVKSENMERDGTIQIEIKGGLPE